MNCRSFSIILVLFFVACNAGGNRPASVSNEPGVFGKPVSFDIVYYKKPFTDSIRYSRFFRVTHTNDSILLRELDNTLQGKYDSLSSVKKCLSEGKLILPLGGDAYRTFYFSRQETGCSYVYYIKNGLFYYFNMSDLLNERLDSLENSAIEPKGV